jgi:VWFA-related protein
MSLAAGAALLLALGAQGSAQQPAKPASPPAQPQAADQAQQPPIFRAGINYVRVDVIISDKNGNPVADMQASDFDVFEDNKPQKIDTFKLIKLDGGTADAIKDPPKEIRNDFDEESEAARDGVRLFAIFLDDYHVRRGTSMAVRGQLSKFIDTQIGPSDMVGVMYPLESTGSVRMTRNHSAVSRGLQQFLGRKYEYEPKNQFEEQYAHYPTETVERVRNQVSLSALKALIIHMGSLKEGRKSLILVSEGYLIATDAQRRRCSSRGSSPPPAIRSPARTTSARIVRPGPRASTWTTTCADRHRQPQQRRDLRRRSARAAGFNSTSTRIAFQTDRSTDVDDGHAAAAAENTDGRAIVNRNDIATGMKQITRDSSAYCLIGYNSAQAPADSRFHEIKVKVKASRRAGARAKATGRSTVRSSRARPRQPSQPPINQSGSRSPACRPPLARAWCLWVGMSRGENGKTRVVRLGPLPKAPAIAAREEPARVSLMAIAPRRLAIVPQQSAGRRAGVPPRRPPPAPRRPRAGGRRASPSTSRPAAPARISVEGAGAGARQRVRGQRAGLTSAQATLGAGCAARAQRAQCQAAGRRGRGADRGAQFNRIEHLLVRIGLRAGRDDTPTLSVHLLNRTGAAMNELKRSRHRARASSRSICRWRLPPAKCVLEIKAGDQGDATWAGRLPASAGDRRSRLLAAASSCCRNRAPTSRAWSPSTSRSPMRAARLADLKPSDLGSGSAALLPLESVRLVRVAAGPSAEPAGSSIRGG